MSQINWQTVAALAAVAWALVYVGRAARRTIAKRSSSAGCGACGSCPSKTTSTGNDFITVDALKRPSP